MFLTMLIRCQIVAQPKILPSDLIEPQHLHSVEVLHLRRSIPPPIVVIPIGLHPLTDNSYVRNALNQRAVTLSAVLLPISRHHHIPNCGTALRYSRLTSSKLNISRV